MHRSVASIAASNAAIASYAGPGGFNDFDMMEVGNGGLSTAEERAHFGLWAISKSPLILGTDLTKISQASLAIITNKDVIAINQDKLGKAAGTFQPKGGAAPSSSALYPYWAGQLSDGWVIGLVAANGAATLTANFADIKGLGSGPFAWKELYTGATGTGTSVSATLTTHDMAIFKITTGTSTSPATTAPAPVATTVPPAATTPAPAATNPPSTATVAEYGQCGGIGFVGSTACASPYTCHAVNDYYSQCY